RSKIPDCEKSKPRLGRCTSAKRSYGAGRPVCVVEVEARACPLRQLLRGVLQYLPHEQHARFSNRPSRVKRFQAIHQLQCPCRSRARASLRTRHQGPFHHGDSKTRWNNLSGDLAVNVTAGSSGHTNSPHPSSRERHHSTVGWSSISSYCIGYCTDLKLLR